MPKITTRTPPTASRGAPKTRRGGQRPRGVARVETILAAALAVLVDEGYESFTLRNISRRARITLSTLQHYYPSKEDLFRAVVDKTITDYDRTLADRAAATDGTARARLEVIVDYLLQDLRRPQTSGFFLELWSRAFRDPYVNELMLRAYRHHRDMLRIAMAPLSPALPGRVAEQRAVIVAALIEGMQLFIGAGKPADPALEGIEQEIKKLIVRLASTR
jgi:TetR/AcrR family transcriptional regulator